MPFRLNHFFRVSSSSGLSGWRKSAHQILNRLGPTWRSSPMRRSIQTASLLLFFFLLFQASWPYSRLYAVAEMPGAQSWLPVEAYLWLDPLVGLSAALAARAWNVAIIGMAVILLISLIIPRGFCSYLCPLGTLIDLFDTGIGKRIHRFRRTVTGQWANLRFHLLATVLVAALCGILLAGFVSAIPVLTRGLVFTVAKFQLGFLRSWSMVPPTSTSVCFSIALCVGLFGLGLIGPRFWCRYVCPTGALLSLPGLVNFSRRRVHEGCVQCGKCAKVCPFDAVNADFSIRATSCAQCQTCAGECPTGAIYFGTNGDAMSKRRPASRFAVPMSRRALLAGATTGAATVLAGPLVWGTGAAPLRPPGSVPEDRFLDLCIRCEHCLQACPGPALQPAGLQHGLEALWTPVVVPTHAGCHQECNFCGQVCPTGAIEPLLLTEKKRRQIGLAEINLKTCLPHRGERECRVCFDECNAAGYRAIQMREVKLAVGHVPEGVASPEEIEAMGRIEVPFVNPEACVGCGLCEYRCHTVLFKQQKLLSKSAVEIKPAQMQRTL